MKKIILSTSVAALFCMATIGQSSSLFAGINPSGSGETTLSPLDKDPFVLNIKQSRLHIEVASEHKNATITMFDLLGNKVFELPANDGIEYPVANLKSGLYFIVLKGGKVNFTRKFLHKQEG